MFLVLGKSIDQRSLSEGIAANVRQLSVAPGFDVRLTGAIADGKPKYKIYSAAHLSWVTLEQKQINELIADYAFCLPA
jgi:hypothetical protein